MQRSATNFRLLGILATTVLIAGVAFLSGGRSTAAQGTMLKVLPASQTVDLEDGAFTVDITVENVANLASFEFILKYNPSILRFVKVETGPFLGSTGRQVQCRLPIHYSPAPAPADADLNAVRFGCNTIDLQPPAPNGSGTLATLTFAPRRAGTSQLSIVVGTEAYGFTDPLGNSIDLVPQNSSIKVEGTGPEPTPRPDEPTPVPTQPPPPPKPVITPDPNSWLEPEPGQTVMTQPVDRIVAGAIDVQGSSGSRNASQGQNAGSPRAGEGPSEEGGPWWISLLGGLLAFTGALLIPVAIYIRGAGLRRRI
jgi:hypothetical protein